MIRPEIKEIVDNVDKFELQENGFDFTFYFIYKNIQIKIERCVLWILDDVEIKIKTKTNSFKDFYFAERLKLSKKEKRKIFKTFKKRMKNKNKVDERQNELLQSINFEE